MDEMMTMPMSPQQQQQPKSSSEIWQTQTRSIIRRSTVPIRIRSIMIHILSVVIVLLCSSVITTIVMALPNGAPVCTVGEAAPQVLHLDINRNPRLGTLNEGGFFIQIGDTILSDTTTIYEYPAHVDIPIVVSSESGQQPFKGVLIVASRIGADLNGNLFLRDETQIQFLQQAQCDAGRVAVTHWNNNTKTTVTATMNFDQNYDPVLFDVNLVIVNNNRASIFYYTQYKVRITGATQSPTPVPINNCGLLMMGLLCIPKITFCGFIGRLLQQDQRECSKPTQFFAISYDGE